MLWVTKLLSPGTCILVLLRDQFFLQHKVSRFEKTEWVYPLVLGEFGKQTLRRGFPCKWFSNKVL